MDKADVGDVLWCGNLLSRIVPKADIEKGLYDVRFQELCGNVVSTSRVARSKLGQ